MTGTVPLFRRVSERTAAAVGSAGAFAAALGACLVWALSGPLFGFSDSWQLVINTGTTIVTFLMVFLIQGSQNRDSKAIHLKLDELLRAVDTARNTLVDVQDCSDDQIDTLHSEFKRVREKALAGSAPAARCRSGPRAAGGHAPSLARVGRVARPDVPEEQEEPEER